MNDKTITVDNHKLTITNPGRILFAKAKITKWQMINYYQRIAPLMLPHIKDKPISMQRFPLGIAHKGFFQKDAPDYFPAWIKLLGVQREDKHKVVSHVLCNNTATLMYLANQAVITPHVWLSRADRLNYPDCIIFDLDPARTGMFDMVREAAKILKNCLEGLGMIPFVMTTGSRGLHVFVPIKRELMFDNVRAFSKQVASLLAEQYPKKLTIEVRKNKRGRRIFLDYLRNAWAATAVAPYAVRPNPEVGVATPLDWKEVNSRLTPRKYTMKNMLKRVQRIGDPWKDIAQAATSVKAAQKRLNKVY